MTRTTDDLNPDRFQPFGQKVEKPKPAQPDWRPVAGSPGVEQHRDGRFRTNIKENGGTPVGFKITRANLAELMAGGLVEKVPREKPVGFTELWPWAVRQPVGVGRFEWPDPYGNEFLGSFGGTD